MFIQIYMYVCIWVSVCLCSCVAMCICACHKDMLFYNDSKYSRHLSYRCTILPKVWWYCQRYDDIDICWNKWADILIQHIGLYSFTHTHTKDKRKHSLPLYSFLSYIFILRQTSKCTHKAKPFHAFKYFFMVSSEWSFFLFAFWMGALYELHETHTK